MADGFSINVEGIAETAAMLHNAPNIIASQGHFYALRAGANVIADILEQNTPIKAEDTGGLLDQGVLRESVMIDIQLDSKSRGGTVEVGFGKNGFVAYWLEYGHKMVGHKPDKRFAGKVVPPNPFVRRAAQLAAEPAIDAYAAALKSVVISNFPQGRVA